MEPNHGGAYVAKDKESVGQEGCLITGANPGIAFRKSCLVEGVF
jgi:hypothetical protein